jgi:uncharacterized membrane protein
MSSRDSVQVPAGNPDSQSLNTRMSRRVATIDWMRGFVMVLMTIDYASMAFDAHHLDNDSAMYANASTMVLPAAEFFTRWMTHLCAPTLSSSWEPPLPSAWSVVSSREPMRGISIAAC